MRTGRIRYVELDIARAVAILAMFTYHFCWDLQYFGLYRVSSPFVEFLWMSYARCIGAMFLFIAGMSAIFSGMDTGYRLRDEVRRLCVIGVCAAMISLVTWVIFPQIFIYMGILHLIAVCGVLAMLMRGLSVPVLSVISCLVVLLDRAGWMMLPDERWAAWIGLSPRAPGSLDYYPLFPWLAVFVFGMACAKRGHGFLVSRWHAGASGGWREWRSVSVLAFMGRHSLMLYLIHQPVFFALFYLYFLLAGYDIVF